MGLSFDGIVEKLLDLRILMQMPEATSMCESLKVLYDLSLEVAAANGISEEALFSENENETNALYNLYGGGLLDSIQLVSFSAALEEEIQKRYNVDLEILNESSWTSSSCFSSFYDFVTTVHDMIQIAKSIDD